jgi:hypothetical protein
MAAAMDEKDPSFQFWRITTDGNLPLVKYYLETSFNLQNQPESTILALPEIPHELLPPSDFKIYNQGEEVGSWETEEEEEMEEEVGGGETGETGGRGAPIDWEADTILLPLLAWVAKRKEKKGKEKKREG